MSSNGWSAGAFRGPGTAIGRVGIHRRQVTSTIWTPSPGQDARAAGNARWLVQDVPTAGPLSPLDSAGQDGIASTRCHCQYWPTQPL